MSRKSGGGGLTPKGEKIVAALSELRDALASGEPLERRFTVDAVERPGASPDPGLVEALAALRRERQRRGLSLSDVAGLTGISKGDLSKLETGKVGNPTVGTLRTYARALGRRLVWSLASLDEAPTGRGARR